MIDLRKLILMIKEQKGMDANLSLEFECNVEHEDPKPLVKIINYLLNYLTPLTEKAIEISLNAGRDGSVLSFAVFTEQTELPALSDQLGGALELYNASLDVKHQQGEYLQIILTFK
jgi:hypothetical protein